MLKILKRLAVVTDMSSWFNFQLSDPITCMMFDIENKKITWEIDKKWRIAFFLTYDCSPC